MKTLNKDYQSTFLQSVFDVTVHLNGDVLEADVTFHAKHEGPPGHAHGGSIATVLDEMMGTLAWASGHKAVAGRLSVDYRQPVPLEVPHRVTCRIDERRGRKVFISADLLGPEGQVRAQSEGIFFDLGEDFHALREKAEAARQDTA
ncbi:MAG: PaaI family thioesterase [Gammaproteobacteria bacterium]|nr:MAG: PaaI family thioesterase [Gammaproteobacteria bacterium]